MNPSEAGYPRGSAGYRKLLVALFCAGIATFAQLYSPQGVLPAISNSIGVPPDTAALSISISTGALAIGILPWAMSAARFGRARTIAIAIFGSAIVGCLVPFSSSFSMFLVGRAIEGALLAAVPAVAIAYLAEQVRPADAARAAGVYVAGTTVGGLIGRLITGSLTELFGWRVAMSAVALCACVLGVVFVWLAPRSPSLVTRQGSRGFFMGLLRTVTMPTFALLYAQPFLLMGVFVALYNYLGYRLEAPPFSMTMVAVSLLYFTYLAGTATAARTGAWIHRFGYRRTTLVAQLAMIVGLTLTLSGQLGVIIVGLVVHAAGFFAAHAAVTAWTPQMHPELAPQASAGYSLSYYLGSSAIGWAAGLVMMHFGWSVTIASLVALVALAGALTFGIREPGQAVRE